MFKFAVIFALAVAAVYANDAIEPSEAVPEEAAASRFLATTTTTTVYVVTSTVAVSSVTRTCASASNATTVCRRRRGIEEQPIILALDDDINLDAINPAEPAPLEASDVAVLPQDAAAGIEAVPNKAEVASSADPVTVDIIGLDSACYSQQRFFTNVFGLTIRYTTTATLTSTSYLPVTVATKTYVVVGCTPSGFASSLC